MKWVFRQADNKDIDAIVTLVDSAYRGESSRQGWTTEADLLDGRRTFSEEVAEIISAEHNVILLLEEGDKLLASVQVKKLSGNGVEMCSAYLGMFAVAPASQNLGIGKIVIEYAEKFVLENWQCSEMEMTVIQQRVELISWYKKLGYQQTGEVRDFPYGDERYGIPKRDDLVLDVLVKSIVA